MNMELNEIRQMQEFLGIREKPSVIHMQSVDACRPYEVWLTQYVKELRQRCEDKLTADYVRNFSKNLFKEKFKSFQEFQRQ